MKDSRILKIISGLVALVLIIGLLIFTNAFVGNPVSSAMAKSEVNKYIEKNYSSLDLKVEKPIYDFKNGGYIIRAYSEESKDTHFNIYYRNKDIRDDYEYTVEDKFNTIMRFSDEYTKFLRNLLSNKLGYEDNESWVSYDKIEYERASKHLELDQEFSVSLPLKAEVSISLKADDLSLEGIEKILVDCHDLFLKNSCVFYEYSVMIGSGTKVYNIFGIKPQQIEDGDLLQVFNKAVDNKDGEYEGVSIFIKE